MCNKLFMRKQKPKTKSTYPRYIIGVKIADIEFQGNFITQFYQFRSRKQRDGMAKICEKAKLEFKTS